MISYEAEGFNERLHALVFRLVEDAEDARHFIKIMLLIQEQYSANDMDLVAAIASQYAYESTKKHVKRTRAYIKQIKAELAAEFKGEGK